MNQNAILSLGAARHCARIYLRLIVVVALELRFEMSQTRSESRQFKWNILNVVIKIVRDGARKLK